MTAPAQPPSGEERRVQVEVSGGVCRLTLDSPHNRNALSDQLMAQLHAGLELAGRDDSVRAVVLGHTGGTFCAGADLSGSGLDDAEDPVKARAEQLVDLLEAIVACPRPVVGQIDGHVRAGGMGLVGACDVVVAGPASTFALTEARLGLAASVISLTLLPRLAPRAASRLFLTGAKIGPAEAEAVGLVTTAVEETEGVEAAVEAVLADLRACSPQGLRETKAMINHGLLEGIAANRDRLSS